MHYTTLLYNYNYSYNYHYTTLQLQLHYTTATAALHHTTSSSCVRWPLQPLQPLQETQLQPPFGPSVDSLCHPWFTTTNLSYSFPILETSAAALCGTTGNQYAQSSHLKFDWAHTGDVACIQGMRTKFQQRRAVWVFNDIETPNCSKLGASDSDAVSKTVLRWYFYMPGTQTEDFIATATESSILYFLKSCFDLASGTLPSGEKLLKVESILGWPLPWRDHGIVWMCSASGGVPRPGKHDAWGMTRKTENILPF